MTLDGNILPNGDPKNPSEVVFSDGTDILAEWPVDSRETGERRLRSALKAIGERSYESTMTSANAIAEQELLTR